jgi:hypothetical protein
MPHFPKVKQTIQCCKVFKNRTQTGFAGTFFFSLLSSHSLLLSTPTSPWPTQTLIKRDIFRIMLETFILWVLKCPLVSIQNIRLIAPPQLQLGYLLSKRHAFFSDDVWSFRDGTLSVKGDSTGVIAFNLLRKKFGFFLQK